MTTDDIDRAIAKARSINDLHASHDAMQVIGDVDNDGNVRVRCSCGVEMIVTLPFANVTSKSTDTSEAKTPVPLRDAGRPRVHVKDKDGS